MTSNIKKAAYLLIAVFLFALDRFFKDWALKGYEFSLIKNFLSFKFAANPYIAFSLPIKGMVLNFIIASLIVGLIYYLAKEQSKFMPIFVLFFSLIILGAVSNFWDRLIYGYVIDYFDCKYFTVFNLADAMIFVGVITYLFSQKKITQIG
ncbi:MAG: signal peptidase II [bacterium]